VTAFLACLSLMAGVALGSEGGPSGGAGDAALGIEAIGGAPVDSLFRFHSRFWPNLHHFAYEQALLTADPPRTRGSTGQVASADDLSAGEAAAWAATVSFYRDSLVERDLLFDDELIALDRILGELSADADEEALLAAGVPESLAAALADAAPVYRRRWWPVHDEVNRQWIDRHEQFVVHYGGQLAAELADAYQAAWPSEVIDVDVLAYANWAGAYTSTDPPHIRLSSSLEENSDWWALETVFHEASHTMVGGRRGAVAAAIRGAAEEAGVQRPRWLWHAIIFYTTGELVRRALQEDTAVFFVPYAIRQQLWFRDEERRAEFDALQEHWQPYLDGEIGFESAIAALVKELQ
jgi:hypothetical protein